MQPRRQGAPCLRRLRPPGVLRARPTNLHQIKMLHWSLVVFQPSSPSFSGLLSTSVGFWRSLIVFRPSFSGIWSSFDRPLLVIGLWIVSAYVFGRLLGSVSHLKLKGGQLMYNRPYEKCILQKTCIYICIWCVFQTGKC